MGKPSILYRVELLPEYIGQQGKPGELKHLSTPRKINQFRDYLSSGERTGNSPNLMDVKTYRCCSSGVAGAMRCICKCTKELQNYLIVKQFGKTGHRR
jgi:hypothetical protein